jgi:hypothetical protein
MQVSIYNGSPYRYTADQWAERCFRTEPRLAPTPEPVASESPFSPTSPDHHDRTEHGA